jgi:hypothetical protein
MGCSDAHFNGAELIGDLVGIGIPIVMRYMLLV